MFFIIKSRLNDKKLTFFVIESHLNNTALSFILTELSLTVGSLYRTGLTAF
jgi:hypothetical protein